MVKLFTINVAFRAAGDMFTHGLAHAAQELGIQHESAFWNDPNLPVRVARFKPDLLLVIHGREFVAEWDKDFKRYNTAVWLVDEPYEVDNTELYSGHFNTVFIQDPNTINRHVNAHYLPVCYDPSRHFDAGKERIYKTGFIGTHYKSRQNYFTALAKAGHLSYLIGGPWNQPGALRVLSKGTHVPPSEVAEYYQQTQIIVNVWRERHHFNRENVPGYSLNPRIYEALACGALVVSEPRPELEELFPELPTFDSPAHLVKQIEAHLDSPHREGLMAQLREKLKGHTYADRLKKIIEVCGLNSVKEIERQEWEYKNVNVGFYTIPVHQQDALNDVGCDGWELVSVDDGIAYFKRPKQ